MKSRMYGFGLGFSYFAMLIDLRVVILDLK